MKSTHQNIFILVILALVLSLAAESHPGHAADDNKTDSTRQRDSAVISRLSTVPNGNFEKWQDGTVTGWNLDRGKLFADEHSKMRGNRSVCIQVDPQETMKWPFCRISSDSFSLEPNTGYRMRLWVTSAFQGWVETIIHSMDDSLFSEAGRVTGVHAWAEDFYTTNGFPWVPVEVEFMTGDSTDYGITILATAVKLGPNDKVWIDDVRIEKTGKVKAMATTEDHQRGFQLFSRSVMKSDGLEKTPPEQSEIVDTLNIRMSRGEFEPALLGLHALQDLEGVDLAIATDLKGSGNATLSKTDVVIRRLDGALLPLSHARTIGAHQTIAWWVTAHAKAATAAGIYDGQLNILVAGKTVARLPLSVEVMDLTLPEPDIAFLVYHHEAYFPPEFLTAELRASYYQDMLEHGMNTITVYNNPANGEELDFSRNYTYKKESPMFTVGLDQHMEEILDSGLCKTGQPVFWLPLRYGSKATLKSTLERWKDRQWPTPLLYVHDEPGGTGARAEAALAKLKQIRSWDIPVKTTTAGLDPRTGVLGQFYDVWVIGDRGIHYENHMNAQKLGCELWQYNCNSPHENMAFARSFYGFLPFRTGVKGVAYWAYYDARKWLADSQGNAQGDPGSQRLSLVCVSPTGPIPTLAWEAVREGIDDYRYCQLFQSLLNKAEKRSAELPGQLENLEHQLQLAQRARNLVIESIPFDIGVARFSAMLGDFRRGKYRPPLALTDVGEDSLTITETKRWMITNQILVLQDNLRQSESFTASKNREQR